MRAAIGIDAFVAKRLAIMTALRMRAELETRDNIRG
jgi:hypothetical protein